MDKIQFAIQKSININEIASNEFTSTANEKVENNWNEPIYFKIIKKYCYG